MKYLTIYRPYELVKLREEGKKGANGEAEAKDWDTALEKYTKDEYKIIKGGSWLKSNLLARCSVKEALPPNDNYGDVGFRCVK